MCNFAVAYFEPATRSQTLDELRGDIASIPGVTQVSVVEGEAARAEVERLFASDPEALESVLASGLTPWISVQVADLDTLNRVQVVVEANPSLKSFETTEGIPLDALTDAELARWCGDGT